MRRGTSALLEQFWRSQARIGAEVVALALDAWKLFNPLSPVHAGAYFVSGVLEIIRLRRARSRANAIRFYRLYRALETGYTVQLPDGDLEDVTLGDLRDEWASENDGVREPEPDDDRVIPVEEFEWPDDRPEEYDRTAVTSLVSTGPARVRDIREDAERAGPERGGLDDPDVIAELESAGRNAARSADRATLLAGRDLVERAGARDRRVVGWARVTDGNPCSFCAMLASRGAIYTSRQAAEVSDTSLRNAVGPDDIRKYHNGCHCQAVPVFSRSDFWVPGSRELYRDWQKVTRGLSGREARIAWRRHIEAQQRTRRQGENELLLTRAREAYRNGERE